MRNLRGRWHAPGGYRDVLMLAFPLIISTGAWSIQHFVDRMFLTWYSPEAIAASTPAGMLNFTIMSIFIGTGAYVNTFVAQYYGAKRYSRIGPAVWQGLYMSLLGGMILLFLSPFSDELFALIGHAPQVARYEALYFRILCYGAFPAIAATVMSEFFSGRGDTRPVMWVSVIATTVNMVLDYTLVFGKFGFSSYGVAGAAFATVFSQVVALVAYMMLASRTSIRTAYCTWSGWRPDMSLLRRLMRFGLPNGIQFFLEIAGFTFFILLVGKKGTHFLAASNIALNINSLAFLPMIGLGLAISIRVGQFLGADDPDTAEKSVWSGFHMMFVYMAAVSMLFVFTPNIFIAPYAAQADASFEDIRRVAVVILRFIAYYSFFDALNITFSYAIKGAGDTRFVMKVIVFSSLLVMVVPSYIGMILLDGSIYVGWTCASAFITILGVSFIVRFIRGRWKTMRVIEAVPPPLPSTIPDGPVIEFEP